MKKMDVTITTNGSKFFRVEVFTITLAGITNKLYGIKLWRFKLFFGFA